MRWLSRYDGLPCLPITQEKTTIMQRINFQEIPAQLTEGLFQTEKLIKKSGIEPRLLELVKLRASLINGCAFCIDMHYKDARHMGEEDQRLYSVSVWRECPYYSEKEKAALHFTEVLTNTNQEEVSDEVFGALEKHFTKDEIVMLTMAICQINTWNRLNKTIRTVPGWYQPGQY